jgi:hypothetical protein
MGGLVLIPVRSLIQILTSAAGQSGIFFYRHDLKENVTTADVMCGTFGSPLEEPGDFLLLIIAF